MCDSIDSVQTRDCIKLVCVTTSLIYLNAFILSDFHLLILSFSLSLVCKLDYI